jgi:SAM-dependent methyltransferase/uncharacterized protein YbaR (Trm112 family)
MKRALLDLLACPRCHGALRPRGPQADAADIVDGALGCDACQHEWPIVRGIPRFVPKSNYAASFGLQWNAFRREQLDRYNQTDLSARRLFSETGWDPAWMAGKWLLDVGCGAGRFLDVASTTGAQMVGVDLSNAVDAAAASLADRPNVHLVQASVYELPFRPGVFDGAYCIGVIQHTPDPAAAVASIPGTVKPGGRLALTIYERRRFSKLYAKYLVRPVTRRLDKQHLLRGVSTAMPLLFPLTEVLFRVPRLGRYFQFAIPVANYVHERQLSLSQRYRWAIMDTYDMLAPEYDQPQTFDEVRSALARAGVTAVRRLPNPGLNVVAER